MRHFACLLDLAGLGEEVVPLASTTTLQLVEEGVEPTPVEILAQTLAAMHLVLVCPTEPELLSDLIGFCAINVANGESI